MEYDGTATNLDRQPYSFLAFTALVCTIVAVDVYYTQFSFNSGIISQHKTL